MQAFMKYLLLLAALASAASAAADPEAASGLFGPLDLAAFPHPRILNPQPVLGAPVPVGAPQRPPIHVHVPPGRERLWPRDCRDYNACNVPVYFVKESWLVNVYLPAVGANSDLEQRYRELTRNVREEREEHDGYEEP